MSWHDAVEFCARLSQKTGRIYHLPSEAEWEYACRAGTTTLYYFGDTITNDLANYNGNYKETSDVGKFPASYFGLFDVCGNVWEWCQDEWHDNYNQAPCDGSAWIGGQNKDRLLRGGSWDSNHRNCRSANRTFNTPKSSYSNVGFRLVAVVP